MSFVARILSQLDDDPNAVVVQEVHADGVRDVSAAQLAAHIATARAFLRSQDLPHGARCGVAAPNSARWIALNLAVMSEGHIAVALYNRQIPADQAAIIADAGCAVVCADDAATAAALQATGLPLPDIVTFDTVFSAAPCDGPPFPLAPHLPVTLIYTSGTSGRSKGAILTAGNVSHMLECTGERLDALLKPVVDRPRIFHYLPLCFAGSWILMLTALSRPSTLQLSTDLTRLPAELQAARPHTFLNVPALLERVRQGIIERFHGMRRPLRWFLTGAEHAAERAATGQGGILDGLWSAVARRTVLQRIRRQVAGDAVGLICGSAPLAPATQRFFERIGLPVLQVYGLTETTAICTMDHPGRAVPGRVGPAIRGIEMRLAEQDEIVVRGPHIFAGYWNRPQETAAVLRDGWFHTGDQGEVDADGNWRIIGRLKNLIILNSGHNIVPDPIEERLRQANTAIEHVVVLGNGRSFLTALVTGRCDQAALDRTLQLLNEQLPHYQRIHCGLMLDEPFTPANGLLTANGKLRRDAIEQRFRLEIAALYERRAA